MRAFLPTLLICLFPILVLGQNDGEVDIVQMPSIELPAELDRVLRDYEKGWREKDANWLASLFSEDGFILRPRNTPIRGRTEIAKAYAGSGGPLHLRAIHYSVQDSLGYIIGAFQTQEQGKDVGKFILTLNKVEDRWMISADMDNANW